MKLLLTSAGITNASIATALWELVGKKPENTSLAFVPTAANLEIGDKGWFIDDLVHLKEQGFKRIDIADISAVDIDIWKAKMDCADVLFFEGGDTHHLMEWMNRSGLSAVLPGYLKTKVYVGVSAGSMVTNKDLALKISQILYDEDFDRTEETPALNLVDFYFLPHLNSDDFQNVREETIKAVTKDMTETIYALDDQSALKVVDGNVEVISEGKWFAVRR